MDFSEYATSTPEWAAYVARHPKLLVDGGIPNQSLANFRAASNKGRSQWSAAQVAAQGLEGRFVTADHVVRMRDGSIIPMRCYSPASVTSKLPLPAFIHFHGGGYLNGSLDTEGSVCGAIAAMLSMRVVHPEYRHTHEVHYPVPHHDAWDSFEWTESNAEMLGIDPNAIVVGGQSAGSGLAASLVQREARLTKQQGRKSRITGQVLTVPWVMHPAAFPYERFANRAKTSPVQCAEMMGLSTAKLEWFASLLRAADPTDPELNPGLRRGDELDGVPRAAFLVAGGDPLRDQGLFYAKSLEEAGVTTKVHVFPAVPHTFRNCDGLPSAKLFVKRLLESIQWVLEKDSDAEESHEWIVERAA